MGAELFLADGRSNMTKLFAILRTRLWRKIFRFTANSFFSRHKINWTPHILTSFNTIVMRIVYVFCIIGQQMIILGRNM